MTVFTKIPAEKIGKSLKDNDLSDLMTFLANDVRALLVSLVGFEHSQKYIHAMLPLIFKSEKRALVRVDLLDVKKDKYVKIASLSDETDITRSILFFRIHKDWEEKAHAYAFKKAKKENPDKNLDPDAIHSVFSYCQDNGLQIIFYVEEKTTATKEV